ncbi:RsmF rRNA methyltransferase first C-terminal domain-containing protein [Clostridium sp. AM58-1XD]|uniref:RsmF rRNA methyltransferase first C-terminal domain-containing protein n=1 Tax=Clostridium sp. AM58-1XD TaxID=2292307 RepID=UPI000E4F27B6|nr:RsmF rRNA methyltransferase first C-terminal domain-containing protein [Clostridium sp. AM58-1XD]RGY98711.1 NOL1/NOP2/sun family putative RNA methylase [Clostridium sp. AM58-1XD]
MTGLPEEFKNKMSGLLNEEYEEFIKSYDSARVQGLRLNLLKLLPEDGKWLTENFGLTPVPWAKEGFYYNGEKRPGRHPYHAAGLYYIQEPSAMAVVTLLNPQPGEKILDLCAAPGGKTTQIASRLRGTGFLLSNEIHPARAKILSQNVERMGIGNAVVTNEDSARLAAFFPGFFDRIAVDAPCSGEGMFRKDEEACEEWSPENVNICAARQQEILHNAALMLKAGGTLVYSTCTFSPEEDEQAAELFLDSHPDFAIEDCSTFLEESGVYGLSCGRPEWGLNQREDLKNTFRIWPHRTRGEGHYLAVFKKRGEVRKEEQQKEPPYIKDKKLLKEIEDFLGEVCPNAGKLKNRNEWILFGDQIYHVPAEMRDIKGMKVVRPGLHVAAVKKNRLEPAHGLALWLKKEEAARIHDMDEEAAVRYLRGETAAGDGEKGWTLMCVNGFPLGWAKEAGGILKNHYPKGLRFL